jgi:flagellar FliL protein
MAGNNNSSGAALGAILGTLAAIGSGFAFGSFLLKQPGSGAETAAAAPKEPRPPQSEVRPLSPIVTNLGNPADAYVRLEAAIVLEPDTPESTALAAKITEDLVVYLRTVSLNELQGPTGFQYLREDLRKRAIQLGAGKIKDLFLTAFVVE